MRTLYLTGDTLGSRDIPTIKIFPKTEEPLGPESRPPPRSLVFLWTHTSVDVFDGPSGERGDLRLVVRRRTTGRFQRSDKERLVWPVLTDALIGQLISSPENP